MIPGDGAHRPPPPPRYPHGQPSPSQFQSAHPDSGTRTLGIVALVLAIVPACITWIIAIVLAVKVIGRTRGWQGYGRGQAIAALIVVGCWITFLVFAVILATATSADRDEEGVITSSGRIAATSLRVGDCLNGDLDGERILSVDAVPCDTSHTWEVYGVFELGSSTYPGKDEVARLSNDGCIARFEGYVGIGPNDSELGVMLLYPERSSWHDRSVSCLLEVPDGTTTSYRDSKK